MNLNFNFSRIPEIHFGAGKIKSLPDQIKRFGSKIILLTGKSSFKKTDNFEILINNLKKHAISYYLDEIGGEPTPSQINSICEEHVDSPLDVVVAIGGGSVLDAGKAVSAMLGKTDPVEEYLEGVGSKTHDGSKMPFIAIPTTAGTGSEATKNAVISQLGDNGFKKSMRHNNFVPDIALVDPELTLSCPTQVTAACGMDAFTQLLESYVSSNASPLTDSLAYSGMKLMKDSLIPSVYEGAEDVNIRSAMSYGALLSGITLANAGLGIIHGLASPVGSYYDIPHGVVCGTLVGISTRLNIEILRKDKDANSQYLRKYANIGKLLSDDACEDIDKCCNLIIDIIEEWIDILKIPRLGGYGFQESDIDKVVAGTSIKNNPVGLEKEEIRKILADRI